MVDSSNKNFNSISSLQLDAFHAVAILGSFSLAAEKLHITQSALSQRVIKLEKELGTTLIVRETHQLQLTEVGKNLLRYCTSKKSLEQEFLFNSSLSVENESRRSAKIALGGHLRVAGFSTFTRSILMPLLSKISLEHPQIYFEVSNVEIGNLPETLFSGRADFIFTNKPIEKRGVENHLVGYEENVMVQSPKILKQRHSVFLDHDENDTTTFDFFKTQGKKQATFERNYFDEIYLIIDAVKLGIGRAIVPLHLTKNVDGIEIVSGFKPMKTPVYFTYFVQPYYSQMQKYFISQVQTELPRTQQLSNIK